ncbi:MAG: dicarboxylate transporter, DctM subunit [Peptococcaceae bacterium]|jgi:C4-dicarboxylate transporter DctM subunit|nr:dicarboxylate transporter, DctM subunit [Peptococcaceae bacterium]
MIGFVLFGALALFLVLNVPIAVALGLATTTSILYDGRLPMTLIVQRIFVSNDSFPLLAIPFFMLAGSVMSSGGVSTRLVAFANSLVGWLTGGLAMVVTLTSMFFAAISGSSAATCAAIGSTMIPAMKEKGYDKEFSAAVIAASGTTGIVIPPSVTMVVYGVIAGVSIGDLFIGGFGPGVLMGLSMMLLIYFMAKKRGYVGEKRANAKQIITTFKDSIWGLLMPVIILGGIYGGIFTPTEAAAVAAIYGLVVGLFIYKELKLKDLPQIITSAIISTAVVMFIMDAAGLFSWIITSNRIPQNLAAYFLEVTKNPNIIMLFINILLLIVGTFLNASAAVIILAPILVPVITSVGIDPVFFGVVMTVNMAIGTITPPVGVDLFVAQTVSGVSLERITKLIWPFMLILIVDLLLITYIPQIVMFLPNLMK